MTKTDERSGNNDPGGRAAGGTSDSGGTSGPGGSDAPGGANDPYEIWRQMYEANERAWTAALEQTMGSREFGESSGKMLETMLAAQKSVRDNMRTYLETMNLPTREDIARLGELVVGLEEKVDQVMDRLDAIETAVRIKRAKRSA